MHTDEGFESSSVSFRDFVSFNSVSESDLEVVVTVVLPHTQEVRLLREGRSDLVGED